MFVSSFNIFFFALFLFVQSEGEASKLKQKTLNYCDVIFYSPGKPLTKHRVRVGDDAKVSDVLSKFNFLVSSPEKYIVYLENGKGNQQFFSIDWVGIASKKNTFENWAIQTGDTLTVRPRFVEAPRIMRYFSWRERLFGFLPSWLKGTD